MGRAPAVALALFNWCRGYPLQEARDLLTAWRPCNPRTSAITEALVDILYNRGRTAPVRIELKGFMDVDKMEVRGLTCT